MSESDESYRINEKRKAREPKLIGTIIRAASKRQIEGEVHGWVARTLGDGRAFACVYITNDKR